MVWLSSWKCALLPLVTCLVFIIFLFSAFFLALSISSLNLRLIYSPCYSLLAPDRFSDIFYLAAYPSLDSKSQKTIYLALSIFLYTPIHLHICILVYMYVFVYLCILNIVFINQYAWPSGENNVNHYSMSPLSLFLVFNQCFLTVLCPRQVFPPGPKFVRTSLWKMTAQ